MSDIVTQPGPVTDADFEETALKMLAEMSRLEELMDRERAERDRLKLENVVIKPVGNVQAKAKLVLSFA